ncbi:MAG: NAD(+)/NADH kinase [Bryobacteraceae bacterium]
MPAIKTVGIFTKPNVERAKTLVPETIEWLRTRGIEVRCDRETAVYSPCEPALERDEVPEGCDLIIVFGGDGTLLSASRAVGSREIPVFPVNLGGLGFLTAITVDEVFPELERALRNEHRIGKRKMLHAEVERNGQLISRYEALNDVVFSKAAIARMIDLDAYVDHMFVCTYKSDGLIVATPTGSTAYSLSAGGPIIFPSVGTICLTPICPHTLTNRPVLVPESSLIGVVCRSEMDSVFLTIDGQVGEPLRYMDRVICRSSNYALHLIRPPRMMFFDVLRQKLKWGER